MCIDRAAAAEEAAAEEAAAEKTIRSFAGLVLNSCNARARSKPYAGTDGKTATVITVTAPIDGKKMSVVVYVPVPGLLGPDGLLYDGFGGASSLPDDIMARVIEAHRDLIAL